MSETSWYGVRCIFHHANLGVYEERVTIWSAKNFEESIDLAEKEAAEYCEDLDGLEYANLAQSYKMYDAPENGTEVFSLMRESELSFDDYKRKFFATGAERLSDI